MRIAHIAYCKRSEGHPGGVPLFGHYLEERFRARQWSWENAPGHVRLGCEGEADAALRLGQWLQGAGHLRDLDAVVVDGFWGRGLAVTPALPIFCVAHNTWRAIGRALRSQQAMQLGDVQAPEYARLLTVAVSDQTARDLRELYGVTPVATIRNAVNLAEFRPPDGATRAKPMILYPSAHYPKGGDIAAALAARMPDVDFEVLGGSLGGEANAMRRGDVFLSPSRTEGCSYARLQALACGLPVVASETGLFADGPALDGLQVGTTVAIPGTEPDHLDEWEAALRAVLEERKSLGVAARAWSEANGSLDRWESEWRQLLQTYAT